jgi:hypothetical protein
MSTYSSNLRIELITTGTQAGTWGTTTNDNLSTVLEQAIAGNVTVTTAASSQALTYLNGPTSTSSANQSIRAILTLNTSTGADFAVYAPPVSKQYTIYNASSYVATIYNSTVIGNTTAAGTGVAIPAGATMTVWSDGTNFAQQNSYLNGATLASPAMTGTPTTPTATYGTNTTQVASTAFVQAALQALYPVGSIYSNAGVATNPATLFGFGTWVAFGAGKVLIGVGTNGSQTFANGDTGGSYAPALLSHTHTGTTGTESATHTHSGTTNGMSANATHSHTYSNQVVSGPYLGGTSSYSIGGTGTTSTANIDHNHTFTSGTESANHTHSFTSDAASSGSQTTGNLPPYVAVYMWQRTA